MCGCLGDMCAKRGRHHHHPGGVSELRRTIIIITHKHRPHYEMSESAERPSDTQTGSHSPEPASKAKSDIKKLRQLLFWLLYIAIYTYKEAIYIPRPVARAPREEAARRPSSQAPAPFKAPLLPLSSLTPALFTRTTHNHARCSCFA